jgi:protein ImuB
VEAHDPAADRAGLVELAQWCHRFSPSVGLEDSDAPETLLLDATNLAPLYGGEPALVAQATLAMQRRGLEARLVIADTVSAAWALAHYDGDGSLDSLPLAALRLSDDLLETLVALGAACVGDVLALPREQLRSRFGPLLLLRINQLLGAAPEVIVAVEPPEEFTVEQAFEYPISRSDAIRYAVEQLLKRLAWLLATRRRGALALACRFECEGAAPVEFQFGLFQPTASAQHLLELADLQLERMRLPAPATSIEVCVLRHAPLAERQGALFEDQRTLASSRPLAALVDRLASRLGREAVVRVRPRSDAQPELAYREESLVGSAQRTRQCKRASGGRKSPVSAGRREPGDSRPPLAEHGALDRPLCLLARPAALQTVSVTPDGPPIRFHWMGQQHTVARHWGPERIETGWWRHERAARDYYRVETSAGRRYWLFRRRRDGRWFLHGRFG